MKPLCGWEWYWQRHPRQPCPKCGKKTYIQPSKAAVWHDGEWKIVEVKGRQFRVLQKRCYLCGYREPLDPEYWEKTKEIQQAIFSQELLENSDDPCNDCNGPCAGCRRTEA